MEKYSIKFFYKNGEKENLVGVGKPESNGLEIHVISPDGKEMIRHREALMGFTVSEYKEKSPKNNKINLI